VFTKFNLHPYYSSRISICQPGLVESCELCRYAQNNRGGIVFYDRFVYLCARKGVSPSKAAVDAGISKSLVTKWKTNKVDVPSPDVIKKLAKYFGLSVSEILGEETDKAPTTTGERFGSNDILDEVDIAFYGDFKELDENDKETVRDMVRIMRERRAKKQE
jgi:transcriptional regulator with XRE-family HTH domain